MLSVSESLSFLESEGFRVVKGLLADSRESLIRACESVGFPCVLKIDSSGHKMDSGGVILNVNSVSEALIHLSRFGKVLVQSQVSGVELILGVKKDSVFNQVLMFGVGGTLTELYKDVGFRVCPLIKSDALSLINGLKGRLLLDGYRGGVKVNVNSLINLLIKLSKLAVREDIKELDINPLICSGNDLIIVDARIKL